MKKVLIANRGEIALRIMRSCREMDLQTVAVYSEADRDALFVRYADEAICIGPPPASQSYLVMDNIIEACKKTKADAIHPGYGFLSENAVFADRVVSEGISFIGPTAKAMEIMGNKLSAKEAVGKYKVPLVPGSRKALSEPEEALKIAEEIGYPVLIKAAAGGGGKGMRIVDSAGNLKEEVAAAMREASSAFGDPSVFLEHYVLCPRHIEIQLLADQHGNIVHLFERECSIQRRHQKVIEEAPSSLLTPELRHQMGQCAIDVARACGYVGAGTVEFLMDENNAFYFLEMNTRLQVEHTVTELITGIDLVKEQLKIAMGEKLAFTQDDLMIRGHAIEARVCAEDPSNNFLPDIGKLEIYQTPQGPGVRVDDGFEEGMEIPIHYDPLIAKLVVYGSDRQEAIKRMVRAIDEYRISGVETTLQFCRFAVQHEAFVSGNFDTHFVKKYFKAELLQEDTEEEILELAAIVAAQAYEETIKQRQFKPKSEASSWKRNRNCW